MGMDTPKDLLCFEIFAMDRMFDVVLPMWLDAQLLLTNHHDHALLEGHFAMPFVFPGPDVVTTFTDKSYFANWMADHHLTDYIPQTYNTLDQAKYPAVVKSLNGTYGAGIEIVHSRDQLNAAVVSKAGDYIMQEALVGTVEPIIHFIARDGVMLAAACVVHKEQSELYVSGKQHPVYQGESVACASLDQLGPLTAGKPLMLYYNAYVTDHLRPYDSDQADCGAYWLQWIRMLQSEVCAAGIHTGAAR